MHRFDSFTRALSLRMSRRTAVHGMSASAVVGTAALGLRSVSARQATPVATPMASPVPADTEKTSFLFVQSATSASFETNTGTGDAEYLLTLQGHTGGTVYFSDRPERIFGEAPTEKFLNGLGFSADNPPNAAIVTTNEDGESDVLVVELTEPAYDASSGVLSYGVSVLEDYTGDGLTFAASQQQDFTLAPELGTTSLFIDDCSDQTINCNNGCNSIVGNLGKQGMCYKWNLMECVTCHGGWSGTADQCNSTFSECNGQCFTDWPAECHPGS